MSNFLNQACSLVDLEQTQVGATLNGQQNAVCTVDGCFQQRRSDSQLSCLHGTVLTGCRADTHQSRTCTLHDGLNVSEVKVDQAGGGDQVGNALHTGEQNLVSGLECVQHGDVTIRNRQQSVVRNNDQGINLIAQSRDTGLSLVGAATAFEGEGAGHHTNGQSAEGAGNTCHDGCATGTGATALTCGHKDHVCALEDFLNFLRVILGCLTANLGVCARAKTAGQLTTNVQLNVCIGHQQSLSVSVDSNELNAAQTNLNHAVDCVDATAADTNDLDDCQVVLGSSSVHVFLDCSVFQLRKTRSLI